MKTTLSVLLLLLAIAFPVTAFAALVGLVPPTVFVDSEIAIFAFAFVGLMLIATDDHGYACRPVIVRRSPVAACPSPVANPVRRRSSYGIRRRECQVA